MGEKVFARCWYSGCNLIVHSMKYILFLCLCVDGCVCSKLGMGPGLVSMSPLNSSSRWVENFLFCGRSFSFMGLVVVVFTRAMIVAWPRGVVLLWYSFGILSVVEECVGLCWCFLAVLYFACCFWWGYVDRGFLMLFCVFLERGCLDCGLVWYLSFLDVLFLYVDGVGVGVCALFCELWFVEDLGIIRVG